MHFKPRGSLQLAVCATQALSTWPFPRQDSSRDQSRGRISLRAVQSATAADIHLDHWSFLQGWGAFETVLRQAVHGCCAGHLLKFLSYICIFPIRKAGLQCEPAAASRACNKLEPQRAAGHMLQTDWEKGPVFSCSMSSMARSIQQQSALWLAIPAGMAVEPDDRH